MSDVLIDRCGLRRLAEPLAAWRTRQAEDASVTLTASLIERESSDAGLHEFKRLLGAVYYPSLACFGMLVC